ncbi:MAG: hypothetical protein A2758_00465 [Candidatus Zambryskibacteria bacterium RIFCSPHIGHO2_01_FULL_49_18]|uniref:DNA polymerase III delta subunit-like C-terminal domain-containing protein n=2 Tax=Candidatus Zambryskiibacteriota TaxID=1817925 RepID=A0A1G2T2P8_9BACT|nr:MAG: hypothetical protein A2758_00465 [Candidatus Zambryskibacteria bacterium RIFCSPHIGHO2_01_FULL_49_18]OHB05898.1 MAG: hypothetical protein A3A26_03050 [Candidatus Zambryskibacteria bacterium RIFCSPLOWO2_01_FULL_47_14]
MRNLFGETVETLLPQEEAGLSNSGSEFNIFALTDAIGRRNKREAWMIYRKALASGMVAEEIFYRIFWQIKIMLLASKTKSADEADIKVFPYNKAKSNLKNFTTLELTNLSTNLVQGYHEIRRGNKEMETFLEKTILGL